MNLAALLRSKGVLFTDAGPKIPEDLAGMIETGEGQRHRKAERQPIGEKLFVCQGPEHLA